MSYSSHIKVTKVNEDQFWVPLVKSTKPGRLKGIGIKKGDRTEHWVKIDIDGTTVTREKICGGGANGYENSGLSFDIPFTDTLEVYGKDQTSRSEPRYWVTLVTVNDESDL